MTLLDFTIAKKLLEAGITFEALLAATVMRSTPLELKKLATAFPKEVAEVQERHRSRAGVLVSDGVSPSDSTKVVRMERAMRLKAGETLRRVGV